MAKTARRARIASKRPHDQVTLMLEFISLDTMEGEAVSHIQLEAGLLAIWEWYSEVVARGNCNYVVGYKIKADSVDPADVGTFPTAATALLFREGSRATWTGGDIHGSRGGVDDQAPEPLLGGDGCSSAQEYCSVLEIYSRDEVRHGYQSVGAPPSELSTQVYVASLLP